MFASQRYLCLPKTSVIQSISKKNVWYTQRVPIDEATEKKSN